MPDADVSPERRAEMVRMALAEAGWPDAVVDVHPDGYPMLLTGTAPRAVWWTATAIVAMAHGIEGRCWPCWQDGLSRPGVHCGHDPWQDAPDLRSVSR
jgi:hypothetical protein